MWASVPRCEPPLSRKEQPFVRARRSERCKCVYTPTCLCICTCGGCSEGWCLKDVWAMEQHYVRTRCLPPRLALRGPGHLAPGLLTHSDTLGRAGDSEQLRWLGGAGARGRPCPAPGEGASVAPSFAFANAFFKVWILTRAPSVFTLLGERIQILHQGCSSHQLDCCVLPVGGVRLLPPPPWPSVSPSVENEGCTAA